MARQRIVCSVDGDVLTVWDGSSVRDMIFEHFPAIATDVAVRRSRLVDSTGTTVDLDRDVADGDTFAVVPVPHPGTKPF